MKLPLRFIWTGDWHLRPDRPRCRMDEDWVATQREALAYIFSRAAELDIPVLHGGDIYHYNRVSPEVERMPAEAADSHKVSFIFRDGNHDLPYHRWENVSTSSLGILVDRAQLSDSPRIRMLPESMAPHFGGEADSEEPIIFLHVLTFPRQIDVPPNVEARSAYDLLKQYPNAEWIFTADYHRSFHVEHEGRHVVNPGCLLRQAADMIDYQPVYAVVDTEAGTVEWESIPDEAELVSDEYLAREEERNERIEAFVESIHRSDSEVSLSFVDNLREATELNAKSLGKEGRELIEELIQEEGQRNEQ